MDRILWPIHNTLRYAGLAVLPHFASYAVLRGGQEHREQLLDRFERRLETVASDQPLRFHRLDEYDSRNVLLACDV